MPILVEALLENAGTKIVGLAFSHRANSLAQFVICNPRLPRRLGEPSGLEGPLGFLDLTHRT